MTPVRTCLWYKSEAEEAAAFYTALVPGSSIERIDRPAPGRPAVLVHFTLAGTPFTALSAGEAATHSHAASVVVTMPDQAGIDRIWQAILDHGGREVDCGWIADRWGVNWQVVPDGLHEMMFGADAAAGQRTYAALRGMKKLDLAALTAAHAGEDARCPT